MMAHTFNLTTWEAKAGGSLWIQGPQSVFQDSQGYAVRPYLKKQKQKPSNNIKMMLGSVNTSFIVICPSKCF